MPKQKKRRLADYSTSEMVKLCGMKASSTFENKRDKVFERYEIDPTLFKMDSSIEGGENFYPVVCAELLAILIKNWDKNPSSRKNANRDNVTVTQICDFYRALLKDVDDLPKDYKVSCNMGGKSSKWIGIIYRNAYGSTRGKYR